MTPAQIVLVKSSWAKVEPISDKAAELFYGKLFELAPQVKPMFKSDITEQGEKLMKMLSAAVAGLDDLPALIPVVKDLAVRHIDYGVEDAHYDVVGEALLWTLGAGLGDAFTDDVKAAWTETYTTVATVMKEAAAEAAVA